MTDYPTKCSLCGGYATNSLWCIPCLWEMSRRGAEFVQAQTKRRAISRVNSKVQEAARKEAVRKNKPLILIREDGAVLKEANQ